ncbi:MAG: hypothetical protein ACRD1A_05810 [Terriglobales bacterium]
MSRVPQWMAAAACSLAFCLAATAAALPPPASAQRLEDQALAAAAKGRLDAAFLLASRAAASRDLPEYRTVREYLRQRAVLSHLQRAHGLELARHPAQAAVEYRTALALDPHNFDARAGLAALFPKAHAPAPDTTEMRVRRAAPPIEIEPSPGHHDLHVRGRLDAAVGYIAGQFGLKAYVATNLPLRDVQFDLDDASFAQAMAVLRDVYDVNWLPLDAHTIYFGAASQLSAHQPVALRTFYLPWVATPTDLHEIANAAKTLLGLKDVTTDSSVDALSIRATPQQLDAAEQLLLDLHHPAGAVLLQFKILEVNSTFARDLGIGIPNQFTMFALGPLLQQLQQNAGLSQDIFNLFEQGGLNAVLNSGALGAGALGAAQSLLSPLLQNPFVVFGGGATLMALSVPNLGAQLTATHGEVTSLESAVLRSQAGETADMKIGQRYPVINASFSPISLNPAIAKVIGNGSFIQPFPSFTYEDLGLDAKVTPRITAQGHDVDLQLDLSVTALTGVSTNDIPILSNRHVVTNLSLRDNEPALVAGLFTQQEMTTISGLPGLAQIPGFGRLFSTDSQQTNADQLLLVITPHVVSLPGSPTAGLWLPSNFPSPGNIIFAPPPPRPALFPGRNGLLRAPVRGGRG